MSKRILLIAAEFPPCGGGGVGRPYHLAATLSQHGYQVTVLTAAENLYRIQNKALDPSSIDVNVHRVDAPNFEKMFIRLSRFLPQFAPADRYLPWRFLAHKAAKRLHQRKPFDLVLSTYPCYSNHAVAFRLSKQFDIPWIADYRDPPRWMYIDGHKRQKAFFAFAQRAKHHVVTTSRTQRLIARELQLDHNEITVLRNGCDDLAAQLTIPADACDPFEILHTGSFYPEGRDIRPLIKAASRLEKPIHLRFIGDPPGADTLEFVKSLDTHARVTFDDFMPSDAVLKESARSSALLVIQGQLFENQVPGKIFEYLALQKPVLVITNKGSATYEIAHGEANVIFAEYDDEASIREGLQKVMQHAVQPVDRTQYTRHATLQEYAALVAKTLDEARGSRAGESVR
ncbi:glycosyltransferase [Alteromonas oceanisediminis]|uniref:glycosyltransferase n=1 Tax=Alteromonas oceanisediminis TaxID=2836180 RepID=UPI001BDA14DC|nr:glycosyltransferase [Alteromonas oceanisediminis]MBT0585672.1 glycosyltransferase [Alteromonas oceanisediminis]